MWPFSLLLFIDPARLLWLNIVLVVSWLWLLRKPTEKPGVEFFFPVLVVYCLHVYSFFWSLANGELTFGFVDFLDASKMTEFAKNGLVRDAPFHANLINLFAALVITHDFYEQHITGVFQWGRVVLSVLVLCTWLSGPLGVCCYYLCRATLFGTLKKPGLIAMEQPKGSEHCDAVQCKFLDQRAPVGAFVADQWPEVLQWPVNATLFVAGIVYGLTVYIPLVAALATWCLVRWFTGATQRACQLTYKCRFRSFFWDGCGALRVELLETPPASRGLWWRLCRRALQVAMFLEFLPAREDPLRVFRRLQEAFGEAFPFGDGLGLARHSDVRTQIEDPKLVKGRESLGWEVSDSQADFCRYTTVFLPYFGSDKQLHGERELAIGKKLIHIWFANFHCNPLLERIDDVHKLHLQRSLDGVLGRRGNIVCPTDTLLELAFGKVLFHLATGGTLSQDESASYVGLVQNAFPFLPNWLNFLIGGHVMERKGMNFYYDMRQALSLYAHCGPLKAVMDADDAELRGVSAVDRLRHIAFAFSVAAAAAPAKLTVAVVKRLYADPKVMVPLFDKNPERFVKECARLDKCVPMVNVFSTKQELFRVGSRQVTLPAGTPLHCSIVSANRDARVFDKPDEFNPERPELDQMLTFNGMDAVIGSAPRACPGRGIALWIIAYVANFYKPAEQFERQLLSAPQVGEYEKTFDEFTALVVKLSNVIATHRNDTAPRARDFMCADAIGDDRVARHLTLRSIQFGFELPHFDEDARAADDLEAAFAAIVKAESKPFVDVRATFSHLSHGTQWREKVCGNLLPPRNVVWDEMSSDEAMSRLAFFGFPCHHTRRWDEKDSWSGADPHPAFVNDFSFLADYKVREGFERYGGTAYFDEKFQIVAIYWCHAKRLVRPSDDAWEHAKWVWKTSLHAGVTLVDHLLRCHMVEANAIVIASRDLLPVSHPLRVFFKPFTFRTISINASAYRSLISERGMIDRIYAFELGELEKIAAAFKKTYVFRRLPDSCHRSMWDMDEQDFPFRADASMLFDELQAYVKNYVGLFYSSFHEYLHDDYAWRFTQSLCERVSFSHPQPLPESLDEVHALFAQFIANGSGYHEHVGQVSEYLWDPTFLGCKISPYQTGGARGVPVMENVQTYTLDLALAMMTGLPMPSLLDNWDHLYVQHLKAEAIRKVHTDFRERLYAISTVMGKKNETRKWKFQSFNPVFLEASVSI